MPKFDELSDRELEALRQYIRARARKVTRPDGVAPPAPEAPAPARRGTRRKAARSGRFLESPAAAGVAGIDRTFLPPPP